MEPDKDELCQVCCLKPEPDQLIKLKCQHSFCKNCLKEYISVLKAYRRLTPSKLQCVHEGCTEDINDDILMSIFPGQQGFVLKTIRKCYKESSNPSSVIFSCVGIMKDNRKPLIQKSSTLSRDDHSRATNTLVRDIKSGKTSIQNIKVCNNIHIFNKSNLSKQKKIQCYICGCSYCIKCFDFQHDGNCPIKEDNPMLDLKKDKKQDNFQNFISKNQILRCLNPKCQIPIDKEEGCFWVKCRCSWEMCYPCGKLWGDCEHFSKYPYQKFTPPADWLVKALNLY